MCLAINIGERKKEKICQFLRSSLMPGQLISRFFVCFFTISTVVKSFFTDEKVQVMLMSGC